MSDQAGDGGRPAGSAGPSARDMQPDAARRAPAGVLVIFGASGDLTERKLLPAVRQLAATSP